MKIKYKNNIVHALIITAIGLSYAELKRKYSKVKNIRNLNNNKSYYYK